MKALLPLLCALCCVSCESVHTVYDENGNKVEQDAAPRVSDLQSRLDAEFDSKIKEVKNKEGVPVSSSKQRSRYDKYINKAREADADLYGTKSFESGKSLFQGKDFRDAKKGYEGKDKNFGTYASRFSKDLRPDFLNESKGIEHSAYRDSSRRARMEGEQSELAEQLFSGKPSRYNTDMTSGYIETRKDKHPAPRVINYRDYANTEIMRTREMLGRDKEEGGSPAHSQL